MLYYKTVPESLGCSLVNWSVIKMSQHCEYAKAYEEGRIKGGSRPVLLGSCSQTAIWYINGTDIPVCYYHKKLAEGAIGSYAV